MKPAKKEPFFYSIIMRIDRDVYMEKRKGKDTIVNKIDYECDLPSERDNFEMFEITEDYFMNECFNEITHDDLNSMDSAIHHVKIIMQVNESQFENLIEEFDLSYECETGGAFYTPAFITDLSPADSFTNKPKEIDDLRIDAYVTPYIIKDGFPFLDNETWQEAHEFLKKKKK